jgi:hypothetical protein
VTGGPAAPGGVGGVRRAWLVAGALVAGLLAMRAVASVMAPLPTVPAGAGRPSPTTPSAARPAVLAEATDARLLLGGEDGLLRIDVDTRATHPIPLPGRRFETDRGLIQRDGAVVTVHGGTAYAVPTRPGRPATPLGPASYALASASPGRVWLVTETGDPERWFRLRELDLGRSPAGGAGPAARGVLPLGRRPVAGAPGGVLVHEVGTGSAGSGLAVWDPRTGRLGRWLPTAATLTAAVAARGHAVAWVEQSALHLGDLTTGRHRVVPPPPGTDGFAAPGVFSPDGRTLAAVTRAGFSTRPALALVAVDRATAARVAGSDGALSDRCSPCLAWSPAGDWIFFSRLGPGFGIGAYRLGRPRAVTVPVEVPFSLPPSFAATRPE